MPSDIQLENERFEREVCRPKISRAKRLLIALDSDQIHRAPSGRAWVAFPCENDTAIFFPLRGPQLRRQLFRDLKESRDEYPSAAALRHALNCWDSVARPLRRNPAVRLTEDHAGNIILDAEGGPNPLTSSIEIRPDGWTYHQRGPGLFYRPDTARWLPDLEKPGPATLEPLRELLHVTTPGDWNRILIWLLAALRPQGPYPILVLQGPGKTQAARILRSILDPSVNPILPLPSTESRLHAQAHENYILAYDDIATMPVSRAAMFHRISNGAATNIGGYVEELQRPIILTVPDDAAWTPRDSMLPVRLDGVDPDIEAKFQRDAHAPALRALCDATSQALSQKTSPTDLETWIAPLATQIIDFLKQQPDQEWKGAPTQLQEALPAAPSVCQLGRRLCQIEAEGLEITRTTVNGNVRLHLKYTPQELPPPPDQPEQTKPDPAIPDPTPNPVGRDSCPARDVLVPPLPEQSPISGHSANSDSPESPENSPSSTTSSYSSNSSTSFSPLTPNQHPHIIDPSCGNSRSG